MWKDRKYLPHQWGAGFKPKFMKYAKDAKQCPIAQKASARLEASIKMRAQLVAIITQYNSSAFKH
eukprot:SAG11_NODE_777_length_7218_cov_24.269420_9_plen_65_part_00